MNNYLDGLKKGLPIALGYFAVSFAFGAMCTNGGITPFISTLISATNLTSAGQLAGVNIILKGGSILEIALVVLLINLRYMLMSFSLSQKVDEKMPFIDRLLISFGITDEIFAVSITEKKNITAVFSLGLLTLPFIGWTLGTLSGATLASILPQDLLNALSIALYIMFIAIFVPACKTSWKVLIVVLTAICLSCIFEYVSFFSFLGFGFKTLIATVVASIIGALCFPVKEESVTEDA